MDKYCYILQLKLIFSYTFYKSYICTDVQLGLWDSDLQQYTNLSGELAKTFSTLNILNVVTVPHK